ncbi:MAG: hypothetical protein M9949_14225 [Candidatus Kapabacteria bacterium]|nr:hypothetical protein [Candidatus Kapabacteria bacterium]
MIYKLNTGELIEAKNADEFVQKLNESSMFGYCENIKDFMQQLAERVMVDKSKEINNRTTGSFVADLIESGYVEIL